VFPQSEEEENA